MAATVGAFSRSREPDLEPEHFEEVRERGEALAEAAVDRGSNLIQNVTLLGKHSRNGRTYSDQALDDAVRLYENAPFFLDHPTDREMRDRKGTRSVLDLAGRIRNPRRVGDMIRGTIEVLNVQPGKDLLFALAEQMPTAAGNSHRVLGRVKRDGDQEVVEGLDKVFAVELVTDPATTSGLFESLETETNPPQEGTMEFKDITIAGLRENRADLVEAITKDIAESEEIKAIREENKTLKDEAQLREKADAERDRKELVATKLKESELPDAVITDVFKEQLADAKDEAAIDALIEDRKGLAKNIKGKAPRSHERDPDKAIREQHQQFEEVTDDHLAEAVDTLFI